MEFGTGPPTGGAVLRGMGLYSVSTSPLRVPLEGAWCGGSLAKGPLRILHTRQAARLPNLQLNFRWLKRVSCPECHSRLQCHSYGLRSGLGFRLAQNPRQAQSPLICPKALKTIGRNMVRVPASACTEAQSWPLGFEEAFRIRTFRG